MSTMNCCLAGGVAPSLEEFFFDEGEFSEDEVISLAGMVEARARIPGCKGLERIDGQVDG